MHKHSHTHIRRKMQMPSGVDMWHLWEDLAYIGKKYETKRYETTMSTFN